MSCYAVSAKQQIAPIQSEQDIDAYVSKMSLEEKVGQMTELVIDVIGHWENGNFVLDQDKLERVFLKYKVGSILNAPGPVAQTPEWWQQTIRTVNDYAIRGCGIPCVYGLDQIPWRVLPSEVAGVAIAVIVFSTLAGIVPALIAARKDPVEALRG